MKTCWASGTTVSSGSTSGSGASKPSSSGARSPASRSASKPATAVTTAASGARIGRPLALDESGPLLG
ncbi:MAG: hypothetical protein ACO305_07225, partial [Rubrivivax sp.]